MTTKLAVPTKPEELEELVSDVAKVNELMAAGQFGELVENYARHVVNAKNGEVKRQIDEAVEQGIVKFLKDNEATNIERLNLSELTPVKASRSAHNALHNPQAPGAPLDKEFNGMTDFFRTSWHGNRNPQDVERLHKIYNAFSSVIPSSGGFLIPESMRATLMALVLENSIVRPRAMVVPMETPRVAFPTLDVTSNADSVYGGVVAYWTEEAAALTESSATFGQVVLDAKNLTAYTEVPNQLIADAILAFGAFIEERFPKAIAFFEDKAFFNGTGVGEPLGFLRANATVLNAKEGGQAADTIVWENLVRMFSRMLPTSLGSAAWIVSPNTFPELATMALTIGTGGSAIWLNNGTQGPPMTILGRPVIITEKAPKLGDAGDVNFVDLSYYLVGDRQAIEAASSPHYKFANVKTAYRFVQRVDGRPWIESAITPANGSTDTLSPFVKLAERA